MRKLIALAMLELVFVNSSDGMYTSGNLSVEVDQNLTQGVGTFRARQSRKSWTKEEDWLLTQAVNRFGARNWREIAKYIPGRTGKQCRERWNICLNPELKKRNWTPEEDRLLVSLVKTYGDQWTKISTFLPGRNYISIRSHYRVLNSNASSCSVPSIARIGLPENATPIEKDPESTQSTDEVVEDRSIPADRDELDVDVVNRFMEEYGLDDFDPFNSDNQ